MSEQSQPGRGGARRADDPILTSIIANRLRSIGERMGVVVERSARSPLLVEGRDFSVGIYGVDGTLVERETTTVLVPERFSLAVDPLGSFVLSNESPREGSR
jgi:N-methylhydantoinase B/oxoprolinase/acetone carboxylase alpha subunit